MVIMYIYTFLFLCVVVFVCCCFFVVLVFSVKGFSLLYVSVFLFIWIRFLGLLARGFCDLAGLL